MRTIRVLGLAAKRFWTQDMLHHAAALTYHSLLALFQALVIGTALLGLLGSSATIAELADFLVDHGADERLVESLIAAGESAVRAKSTSAVALIVALVVALGFASSAWVASSTALNVILEARDERSIVARRLQALGATAVIILLAIGAIVGMFLGGGFAEAVLRQIGLGETAAAVWSVLRLPVAGIFAMTAFAWTYYAAPTVRDPRWRWISLGAVVAVVAWLLTSSAFFLFVANVPTYNATYGAFATAVLLIVWLWLTNVALLYGAEVNAAGRYEDETGAPVSETGHSPQDAQHVAARHAG